MESIINYKVFNWVPVVYIKGPPYGGLGQGGRVG